MITVWKLLLGLTGGNTILAIWLVAFLVAGFAVGIVRGFFRARKIQPKGFRWRTFRNEAIFAAVGVVGSGILLAGLTYLLARLPHAAPNHNPASWWVVVLEYAFYFFAFDTWFYWFHRWMHTPRVYPWIHKLHHWSTAPNLLTTFSVNPLESFVNGGFLPIFLTFVSVHDRSMAFIGPTSILMGLYVHSGYEFLPRWWNRSWATKWFITTTFHDQHHKYFNWNFGGYTTIWDRICGTMRSRYESDFENPKARLKKPAVEEDAVVPAE